MTVAFSVAAPGLLTTIQDLGRPNAIAAGVPPGGAMDRFAHRAANLLVGNAPHDATLECTLKGPVLVAEVACEVAITGADLDARVDGEPVAMWEAVPVERGARLTFGGRRTGARAYVAVAGGFDGERWLGSRATSLLAGRGGIQGRALATGDALSVAVTRDPLGVLRSLPPELRPDYAQRVLHVIPGPHVRRLEPESKRSFLGGVFTLSADSNRMGYRLDGPSLVAKGDELLSFALVAGAVQLPGSGHPILLMADHQTAGGYPVIATVVSASMPVAAQLAPGDELSFEQTTEAKARAQRVAQAQALARLASLSAP